MSNSLDKFQYFTLQSIDINTDGFAKLLQKLNLNKAAWSNNMKQIVMKETAENLALRLSYFLKVS